MMRVKAIATVLILSGIFFVHGQEGFDDIFTVEEPATENLSFSGEVGLALSSFMDDGLDSQLTAEPYLTMEIAPAKGDLEALARLEVSAAEGEASFEIDELYLSYFFERGYLQTGLMKVEWGKGDGQHVLDPINPLNQLKGIDRDINEMKDPLAMIKFNLFAGSNGLLELVYLPLFKGHSIAESGRWAVFDPSVLPGLTEDFPEGLSGSSAAARFTTTLGPVDLGFQYYFGFKPEFGIKFDPLPSKVYTRAHLAGVEAAWAMGPFTFRLESGSWLTEDLEGTAAEYWNPSLEFLAGFDFTIPGTRLFFSFQATESLVLNTEEEATTTTIYPAMEFPFAEDKIKITAAGAFIVESRGWLVLPSIHWYPADSYEMTVSGQFFGGEEDSYFKTWEDNSHISLEFKYLF